MKECDMLNPAELKRKITKSQNRLLKLNTLKQDIREGLNKIVKLQVGSSIFILEELGIIKGRFGKNRLI